MCPRYRRSENESDAGRGDTKGDRRAIQEGVERHQRLNAGLVLRGHARPHIERVLIVDEPHVHDVTRRSALNGFLLREVGDRRCLQPDHVVQASVQRMLPLVILVAAACFRATAPEAVS